MYTADYKIFGIPSTPLSCLMDYRQVLFSVEIFSKVEFSATYQKMSLSFCVHIYIYLYL